MELAGFCGSDLFPIDNEHAQHKDESFDNMIREIAVDEIVTLLGIDKVGDNPYLIRKMLEIVVLGFIISDI